jgi:hypothetical protein
MTKFSSRSEEDLGGQILRSEGRNSDAKGRRKSSFYLIDLAILSRACDLLAALLMQTSSVRGF